MTFLLRRFLFTGLLFLSEGLKDRPCMFTSATGRVVPKAHGLVADCHLSIDEGDEADAVEIVTFREQAEFVEGGVEVEEVDRAIA